jgi:hypothetical protein
MPTVKPPESQEVRKSGSQGDPDALLAYLRGAGFAVTLAPRDDGKIVVSPRGKLSPGESEQVVAAKPALLALLLAERAAARWAACEAACERLTACPRCRAWVDPERGADVRTCCQRTDCPQGGGRNARRRDS